MLWVMLVGISGDGEHERFVTCPQEVMGIKERVVRQSLDRADEGSMCALHVGEHVIEAALLARRDEARAAKDWEGSDQLRDRLADMGWVVEDGAQGSTVRRA